jgi:hypothetical protein
MERFSIHSVDSTFLDLDAWPEAITTGLSKDDQRTFTARKTAIGMLVNGDSRSKIKKETLVDRKSVLEFFKDCLKTHPDGRIYGERYLNGTVYVDCGAGLCGLFSRAA